MRSMAILLVCLFAGVEGRTQQEAQVSGKAEDTDSLRSQYVTRFPEYFFIYPVLKQRSLNFSLSKRDRSSVLTYKPNNAYHLGVGAYVFELGIELAFAIPLREKSIERYGESRARDLGLNVLSKRWGLDAFYQRYRGFYLIDKDLEPAPDEPYPQRPDIGTRNFGATAHYIFNHRKFSFRSAYNFAERQLVSNGSFLAFAAINTFRVAADSSIVTHPRQAAFGNGVDFTHLRYTTFSIAPGYTYNLIRNDFFLNATLTVGPAHHWISYELEATGKRRHDIAINPFAGFRVAAGYNGQRVFGGVSFVSQGSLIRFDDVNFSNKNSVFKVLVGYRFREWGILRKRVWDMVPFDI